MLKGQQKVHSVLYKLGTRNVLHNQKGTSMCKKSPVNFLNFSVPFQFLISESKLFLRIYRNLRTFLDNIGFFLPIPD